MTNAAQAPQRITVEDAQAQTGKRLAQVLTQAPAPVLEMTTHLAAAGGKGVRTRLLMYAAMGEDGLVPQAAVEAAAAIELLHLASLVHDDVIDDAALRRGIPTVQNKFGKKQAVICGDFLLCLAASLVVPLRPQQEQPANLLEEFVTALTQICLGELVQFRNNRNLKLEVPGYLRIVAGKTAALFYVSALAGALLAGYPKQEALALGRFGRYLGIVFQIIDDCKDYDCSEDQTLKTVGKDIAEGVITLPLIYALQKSPDLHTLATQAFDDAHSAQKLVQSVRHAKGTDQARALAARYAQKASRLLTPLAAEKVAKLQGLLTMSMGEAVGV